MNTQITEDYVSFETAKLLKEKGFDESTSMVYMSYGELCKLDRFESIRNSNYNGITKSYFKYTAPTLQMAMKWLREVHNIVIVTFPIRTVNGECKYNVSIYNTNAEHKKLINKDYQPYEEAVETALKYCLENLI